MTANDWKLAWEIFRTAAEMASAERERYIRQTATRPELLARVLSLMEEAGEDIGDLSAADSNATGMHRPKYG